MEDQRSDDNCEVVWEKCPGTRTCESSRGTWAGGKIVDKAVIRHKGTRPQNKREQEEVASGSLAKKRIPEEQQQSLASIKGRNRQNIQCVKTHP
ncbi:hypothetical protein RCL_jg28203.t1 [Rhizophagus clarus]|uniref:Uncharacterized protein n=1 Tax=Rhizophagus clarus TaxID=94130 RepID=A0A8H3QUQ3_9GLOM|nr:hypothetical protein RCL_jg28203.t1 [Rhizophagus clarus]